MSLAESAENAESFRVEDSCWNSETLRSGIPATVALANGENGEINSMCTKVTKIGSSECFEAHESAVIHLSRRIAARIALNNSVFSVYSARDNPGKT